MERIFSIAACVLMALGVCMGAFGAHALENYFSVNPKYHQVYETAVFYHLIHALALFAIAWCQSHWNSKLIIIAGYFICVGTIIFSTSLYVLSLTQIKILGAITPIGGIAIVIGWVILAIGILQSKPKNI
jgi:uncharacterized membrane protein YgdD (TMEM256/DUF423 family)